VLDFAQHREENVLFESFVKAGVLLVPGGRFGDGVPGGGGAWFRLGYGTDSDALRAGLSRVVGALSGA
jgi:hypothetical protein